MFRASPPSPCNLYFKHYLGPRCRYLLCFDFFPAFFKWTFATFVFGVHSFVCLVGEQPFCQQLRFYSGFNLGFCLFFLEADLSFRWTNQGRSRSWIYARDRNEANQKRYLLCWITVSASLWRGPACAWSQHRKQSGMREKTKREGLDFFILLCVSDICFCESVQVLLALLSLVFFFFFSSLNIYILLKHS